MKENKLLKSCVIIGLGNIGAGYDYAHKKGNKIFTHAKAIYFHKNFRLVGGIDISKRKRYQFKKIYSVPIFKNMKEASIKLSPDIVIISTPTNFHYENFQLVLKNFKPETIILEKPLTNSYHKAKLIVKECEKKKINLFVNYFRISDPGILKIKKLLSIQYKKDKLFKINAWYSGGLINNGSHLINLFQFIFGKIKSVNIISKAKIDNSDLEPDFQINFKNCSVILRSSSEKYYSLSGFDLIGTEIRIIYENSENLIQLQKVVDDKNFNNYKVLSKKRVITNRLNTYQKSVYDEVYKFYNKRNYNLCSGKEALNTLEVIRKIKKNTYEKK